MGFSASKVFSVDLPSLTTKTSSIDLQHSWDHVHIQVPTMASGSLFVLASVDNTLFYKIVNEIATSTVTDGETFTIDSSCTQRIIHMPPLVARYMKIESTSGATDTTTTFKVICG